MIEITEITSVICEKYCWTPTPSISIAMRLDEQSFQNLLSAAFTIQEYNDHNFNFAAGPMARTAKTDEALNHGPNFSIECWKAGEAQEIAAEAVDEEPDPDKKETVGADQETELQLDPQTKHFLQEIVQLALQATKATGAAIAVKQKGKLICLGAAGDAASEIGAMINAGSGFTGVCASSRTVLLCTNTMLDPRADADACRKIGVRAVIVVPLLQRHQLLGLMAVFSRRPYAFGVRDLQALQELAQKFTANRQVRVESASAHTESAAS